MSTRSTWTCRVWGVIRRTSASPITVTAGSTVSGIDLVLEPGGRVAGTVTDTFGVALPGVSVEVYADPTAKAAATAVTNSLGVYVTPNGLPPGNYTARTTNGLGFINERFDDVACTADCSPAAGTPIPVTPPATTGGIDFVLDADADLDGDGMLSSIDTDKAAFSDGFSDVSQGGATAGTIVARGGWVVTWLTRVPPVSPRRCRELVRRQRFCTLAHPEGPRSFGSMPPASRFRLPVMRTAAASPSRPSRRSP